MFFSFTFSDSSSRDKMPLHKQPPTLLRTTLKAFTKALFVAIRRIESATKEPSAVWKKQLSTVLDPQPAQIVQMTYAFAIDECAYEHGLRLRKGSSTAHPIDLNDVLDLFPSDNLPSVGGVMRYLSQPCLTRLNFTGLSDMGTVKHSWFAMFNRVLGEWSLTQKPELSILVFLFFYFRRYFKRNPTFRRAHCPIEKRAQLAAAIHQRPPRNFRPTLSPARLS